MQRSNYSYLRRAGHDKGLIDAMSCFEVKAILRRDIVTHDCCFENSNDIYEYRSS